LSRRIRCIAGPNSELAKKYRLCFQRVGVADVPESYVERLVELFPRRFEKLRLFELESHDLALSKLARNWPRDRQDVEYLVKSVPLDPDVLKARYEELRPIMTGDLNRHDQTLQLWLEAYFLAS
jgi:Nucleotidyltransferase of unknown function (DUF6036)